MYKIKLFGVSGRIGVGKDELSKMVRYILENSGDDYLEYLRCKKLADDIFDYELKKYAAKLKQIVSILIGCTIEQLEDRVFKEAPLPGWNRFKVRVQTVCGDKNFYFSSKNDALNEMQLGGKLFGLNYGLILEETLSPRQLMQIIGTDSGRDLIHPDIWCKSLFSDFKENSNWIINDLRYSTNEASYIREHNGIIIGVKRLFKLRYPDYAHLEDDRYPYKIPISLVYENPELYEKLTFESEEVMGDLDWADYVIENNGTLEELYDKVKNLLINL